MVATAWMGDTMRKFALAATAIFLTSGAMADDHFIGSIDTPPLDFWSWDVGYRLVAAKHCDIDYDPAKLTAAAQVAADMVGVSRATIERRAAELAVGFEQVWIESGEIRQKCRDARRQAERMDLLVD